LNIFEIAQMQAMRAVVSPTDEDCLRRIFRYYSTTFNTPLHVVSNLPLEDVLLAYFESVYENMSEEDLEEKKEYLLMTEEERKEHEEVDKIIETRDEKFFEQLNADVSSGENIKRVPGAPPPSPNEGIPENQLQKLIKRIQKTKERAAREVGAELPKPKPSIKPQANKGLPGLGELPEFNMTFDPPSNLQKSDNPFEGLDPLGITAKRK